MSGRIWTLLALVAVLGAALPAQAGLIISGVIDGPRTGGQPKAIELYATTEIADLSVWGMENASNGAAFSGVEFALSGSASAGDYLYIVSSVTAETEFNTYFGLTHDFTSSVANNNGDDALGLYESGVLVDVFGDPAAQAPWSYLDSYAYRVDGTGPDGTFTLGNWTFGGSNLLDPQGASGVNGDAGITVPFGTFAPQAVPEPGTWALLGLGLLVVGLRRRRRRAG